MTSQYTMPVIIGDVSPGGDPGHGLVEEPQPLAGAARADEHETLPVQGEGGEVAVVVPLGRDHRLLRELDGTDDVAGRRRRERLGEGEVAEHVVVGRPGLRQPGRPPQPAGAERRVAHGGVLDADPQRAHGRTVLVQGLELAVEGALPHGEVVVGPVQQGRTHREAVEIVGLERLERLGLAEGGGRREPPTVGERRPGPGEQRVPLHGVSIRPHRAAGTADPARSR
ncbi:hypothetical protein [Georgenia sp. SUBG003]|uniref:hypothetical protein n=1 Tax=Georgenia sp. SUBG003 TaxID=1497974 RepID=UPI0004D4C10C|nr:hypothetical protein DA06_18830 [Georgenia sp. SUBG003]